MASSREIFDLDRLEDSDDGDTESSFIARFLFDPKISVPEYSDFENYKRDLFNVTAERLFWIFGTLISITLAIQFFISTNLKVIKNAVLMKAEVLMIIIIYLLGLRLSETVQDWGIEFCCLGLVAGYLITGYFMGYNTVVEHHLSYVYYAPCITILMPIRLSGRMTIAFLLPLAYLTTYLYTDPALMRDVAFPQRMTSLFILCVLCILIGHMFFYLFRQNFRNRRNSLRRREQLEYLAAHDQLTGLYNRRHLENRIDEEIARAKRYDRSLSLLMLDIDHFKEVNDQYGHTAGDKVLAYVGEAIDNELRENVRRSDIGGRFGGEEFVLLLPETDLDGAKIVADRIRQDLEEKQFISPDGVEFSVTCSIGVAMIKDSHDSPEELIMEADDRLYHAKQQGRNRVVAEGTPENSGG